MPNGKLHALIVYYSRTGNTRVVAEELARETGWDIDPIVDTRDRAGLLGYLRSAFDAAIRRTTQLAPARKDPAAYDLVVVATPTWDASVSTPVRTYLTQHAGHIRNLGFLVTCGGMGSARVLEQMQHLAGRPPVAAVVIREADVHGGRHLAAVVRFADDLRHKLAPRPAPAPELHPA